VRNIKCNANSDEVLKVLSYKAKSSSFLNRCTRHGGALHLLATSTNSKVSCDAIS